MTPQGTAPLRVAVWATGTIGRHAIAGIDAHPALELVGVWVSTPEKVGRDAGDLAGLDHTTGVLATGDREEILALAPDCVLYAAITDHRVLEGIEDLFGLVEAGVNVVASSPVLLQWPHGILPPEMLERLARAGAATGASLHVNGIDPGWANDVLPLQLTSLSARIDQVRVSELADYSTYDQPWVMTSMFGFGRPMSDTPPLFRPGMLSGGWGSVVRQIAAGLDLVLDEPLVEHVERHAAETDVSTVSCEVPAGSQGAVRFTVAGCVDGVEKVVLEHVTRTHPDQAPHWPKADNGVAAFRVEVTGEPHLRVEFTHHASDGDHGTSGMLTTAMRLVNAVPAVVAAPGGLVTALDLPLVTGRGLVS